MDHQADPEDILLDSLQSLYDYVPITYSSAGSVFQYSLTEMHRSLQALHGADGETSLQTSNITLVTPTTDASNWSLHASSIWASSLFLADHLDDLHLDQHILAARHRGQDRLRVLELGTGAGLPSILIARCFTEVDMVASDYPDIELTRTLRTNVEKNGVAKRCRVVPYAWGSDSSVFRKGGDRLDSGDWQMDVIVAADTLWNPELHALFLQTLQILLRRTADARIYLVAGLHTGRYTLQAFMKAVENFGFSLESVGERAVSGHETRLWDVNRAEGEEDKERRRWVIWMIIKWQNIP